MSGACPVCEGPSFVPVTLRQSVPVHQNLLVDTAEEARSCTRGTLDFVVCTRCGFGFNRAFDPDLLSYGPAYENDQTHSHVFRGHLESLLHMLIEERGIRDCSIVEVGCGNGAFLRALVERSGGAGEGFDPAYRGPTVSDDGTVRFHRTFFGPESSAVAADVVICRHTIEHVPDPVPFLSAIRESLTASPHVRVFLETPCLEWILRNLTLWDLFYEHCSIFTLHSLAAALDFAGFSLVRGQHVFGGQYLLVEASPAGEQAVLEAGTIPQLASEFSAEERAALDRLTSQLNEARERGAVALWGAGAKGVTLANLLDPRGEVIECLIDVNPSKQGHYVPGTGHPIVAPDVMTERQIRSVLVMNPNYLAEIQALLSGSGATVDVVEAERSLKSSRVI